MSKWHKELPENTIEAGKAIEGFLKKYYKISKERWSIYVEFAEWMIENPREFPSAHIEKRLYRLGRLNQLESLMLDPAWKGANHIYNMFTREYDWAEEEHPVHNTTRAIAMWMDRITEMRGRLAVERHFIDQPTEMNFLAAEHAWREDSKWDAKILALKEGMQKELDSAQASLAELEAGKNKPAWLSPTNTVAAAGGAFGAAAKNMIQLGVTPTRVMASVIAVMLTIGILTAIKTLVLRPKKLRAIQNQQRYVDELTKNLSDKSESRLGLPQEDVATKLLASGN